MLATYAIWPDPGADCSLALSALGLSIRAAIMQLGGPQLGLKWPNDLVVAADGVAADGAAGSSQGQVDKKVGGLLGETHRVGDRSLILLGVGVNLSAGAVPPDLADRATSLDVLGFSAEAADVMCAGAGQLAARLAGCAGGGGRAHDDGVQLIDEYRAACVTIGRTVRVEMHSGELIGVAVEIADDGALVIEPMSQDSGPADGVTVRTGDITHLRDHHPA